MRTALVHWAIVVAFATPVVAQTVTGKGEQELAEVVKALDAASDAEPELVPSPPQTGTTPAASEQVPNLRDRWGTALVAAQRAATGLDIERDIKVMTARVAATTADIRKRVSALPQTRKPTSGDVKPAGGNAVVAPVPVKGEEARLAVAPLPSGSGTTAKVDVAIESDLDESRDAAPEGLQEEVLLPDATEARNVPPEAGDAGRRSAEPTAETAHPAGDTPSATGLGTGFETGPESFETLRSSGGSAERMERPLGTESHDVRAEQTETASLRNQVARLRQAIALLCSSQDLAPRAARPSAAPEVR